MPIYVKNILFWVFILQIKEYRIDRFRDFLSTSEGQRSLVNKSFILEIAGLIAIYFFTPKSAFILLLIFLLEIFIILRNMQKSGFLKPVFTKKALLIILLSCFSGLIASGSFFFIKNIFTVLPLANILTLAVVGFWITLISPLSFILKKSISNKAAKIIKQNHHLNIIGITGSYGKTSVKEFAYDLLSGFFKTVKTEKNNNTEIGVAKTIISNDLKGVEIFVAEIGAYKSGEIKKICDFCPPRISVITGLDEQHSSLFGGLKGIIKAKAEIMQRAKIAILNYDNEHIRSMPLHDNAKIVTYGLKNRETDITAFKSGKDGIWQKFTVSYNGDVENFSTQLPGEHNILNILAAIGIGLSLGLKLSDLKEGVKKLQSPEATLKLIKSNVNIILNDSYNANPSGVIAAIETLEEYDEKPVIILDDILELGNDAKKIHLSIANLLATNQFEKIILVGKNYANIIYKKLIRIGLKKDNILREKYNFLEISDFLINLPAGYIILLEGRNSQKYLKYLTK